MTQSMNAEKAKDFEKLTQTNKKMYDEAKTEVKLVEQINGNKIKYIKRVTYFDKKTGKKLAEKNSLLGTKKGSKMIFGTDKIEG